SPYTVAIHARKMPPRNAITDTNNMTVLVDETVKRVLIALKFPHNQDAIGVRLLKHRAIIQRQIDLTGHMTQKHPVRALDSRIIDASQNLAVKPTGDILRDYPNKRTAAATQRPRHDIRPVTHL